MSTHQILEIKELINIICEYIDMKDVITLHKSLKLTMSWELNQKIYDEYSVIHDKYNTLVNKYKQFKNIYKCCNCKSTENSSLRRCYDCKKLSCSDCLASCGNEYCNSKVCGQCFTSKEDASLEDQNILCKACEEFI